MSLSFGSTVFMILSLKRRVPSVIELSPAIILRRVDLPQPDGPSITQKSLSSISRFIFLIVKFSRPSYFFPILSKITFIFNSYPLTAPDESPLTNSSCNTKNNSITGTADKNPPAAKAGWFIFLTSDISVNSPVASV